MGKADSSQALVDLEPAAPYELGSGVSLVSGYLYPAYVRGQAYLVAHNGTAAASEFQKLLDHRGIVQNFVTGSLAHLQLGRAYAMAGDTAKAKAAYQDFFTLWKDAGPTSPSSNKPRPNTPVCINRAPALRSPPSRSTEPHPRARTTAKVHQNCAKKGGRFRIVMSPIPSAY